LDADDIRVVIASSFNIFIYLQFGCTVFTLLLFFMFFPWDTQEGSVVYHYIRRNIYVFCSCNIQLYHEYCCCVISSLPIGCMAAWRPFLLLGKKIVYRVHFWSCCIVFMASFSMSFSFKWSLIYIG
jgi:hypothetical protein